MSTSPSSPRERTAPRTTPSSFRPSLSPGRFPSASTSPSSPTSPSRKRTCSSTLPRKFAQQKLLNALRVTKTAIPFDTLTFSPASLTDLEELLDLFFTIAEDEFLFESSKVEEKLELFDSVPFWFAYTRIQSVARWVVAHFEIKLLMAFPKQLPGALPCPLQDPQGHHHRPKER